MNFYFANPNEFVFPSNELVVGKIQMASPGGFSLKGLGEPMKELRELIRDLWYRNRQDRERGEIEILQQRLAIMSQFNLDTRHVHVLAVAISADTNELKKLITEGKLMLEGEKPKSIEKSATAKSRKPRKKPSSGNETA